MEIWKPVPGYEGSYEVSNQGRVRSLERRVRLVVRGVETTRRVPPCVLKPGKMGGRDHATVALGKGNSQPVHYLVALAFIGPRPPDADVAHRDGNPANNADWNLRYASRGSNNEDIVYHGRRRLTVEQIRRVRAEAKSYVGAGRALAREFGVSAATISATYAGRSYGHVV